MIINMTWQKYTNCQSHKQPKFFKGREGGKRKNFQTVKSNKYRNTKHFPQTQYKSTTLTSHHIKPWLQATISFIVDFDVG